MALEGCKSNHKVVYPSKYNVVWTPKYRRSVLGGAIAGRCEAVIRQVAAKFLAEIIAIIIISEVNFCTHCPTTWFRTGMLYVLQT